jgi:hypothetical protein
MRFMMSFAPAICCAVGAGLMIVYPLGDRKMRELAARETSASSSERDYLAYCSESRLTRTDARRSWQARYVYVNPQGRGPCQHIMPN